jgi:hypothetical protein
MTDVELRQQVRERYASVALTVTAGGTHHDALAVEEGCCGTSVSGSSGCCSDWIVCAGVGGGG